MDFKVLGLVIVAFAVGIGATQNNFTSKLSSIDFPSDSNPSNKEDVCPTNLTKHFENNLGSWESKFSSTYDYDVSLHGLENWKVNGELRLDCRKGMNQGENVDYKYCKEHTVAILEHEKIADNGSILYQEKFRIDKLVVDQDNNLVNLKCKNPGTIG